MNRHLTSEELFSELAARPGLIPTEIDASRGQLVWVDFETYHAYEGFFHTSLDRFAALKRTVGSPYPVVTFTTELDVLADQRILKETIYPTGFIFHAGRSGSTLLAKVLARDRRHHVISEAAAHNQVWLALADERGTVAASEHNKTVYKNLLLAMGRKRLPQHTAYFIKFTSFNILFFDFIRNAFPNVPVIFLYREPNQILASIAKNPLPWLEKNESSLRRVLETSAGVEFSNSESPDEVRALRCLFEAGLRAGENGAAFLNYKDLRSDNFPVILNLLNINATAKQSNFMAAQFDLDSKVEHGAQRFIPTEPAISKSDAAEGPDQKRLRQLYNDLTQSQLNLVQSSIQRKRAEEN